MSEEEKKPTQSFSISNVTLSDVQIGGQSGGSQINIFNKGETAKQITIKEAIEQLVKDSDLPESQKQKALQHLGSAKEDGQEKNKIKIISPQAYKKQLKLSKQLAIL